MKRLLLLTFIVTVAFTEDKLPNEIRWVRDSTEYESLCKQVYHVAWQKVSNMASQTTGDLAIVMDLDETVMDNSLYEVEITNKGESFNMESWAAWVNRGEAGLVPGAGPFIDSVRALGNVQIIFISNRMAERTEITRENLKSLGASGVDDIYLLRRDKADKKPIRRAEIFNGKGRMESYGSFTVIAWFGDAMGDFPSEIMEPDLGESWFVFPNPMYGKW